MNAKILCAKTCLAATRYKCLQSHGSSWIVNFCCERHSKFLFSRKIKHRIQNFIAKWHTRPWNFKQQQKINSCFIELGIPVSCYCLYEHIVTNSHLHVHKSTAIHWYIYKSKLYDHMDKYAISIKGLYKYIYLQTLKMEIFIEVHYQTTNNLEASTLLRSLIVACFVHLSATCDDFVISCLFLEYCRRGKKI